MILVGCPVSNRGWVLDAWRDHVERAFSAIGLLYAYVFVTGEDDDATQRWIQQQCGTRLAGVVTVSEQSNTRREWNADRYRHMASLRNRLLAEVRTYRPSLFLSIDSDILLHPEALANMLEDLEGDYIAASGGVYLCKPPGRVVNAANFGPSRIRSRFQQGGPMPMDAIMALKLMTPDAYNVDYEYDPDGEDVGWSRSIKSRYGKNRLVWDGRTFSKHVMSPEWLNEIDGRIGW